MVLSVTTTWITSKKDAEMWISIHCHDNYSQAWNKRKIVLNCPELSWQEGTESASNFASGLTNLLLDRDTVAYAVIQTVRVIGEHGKPAFNHDRFKGVLDGVLCGDFNHALRPSWNTKSTCEGYLTE